MSHPCKAKAYYSLGGRRITDKEFDNLCHGCHRFKEGCVCNEQWWKEWIARPEWQSRFGENGRDRCPIKYP